MKKTFAENEIKKRILVQRIWLIGGLAWTLVFLIWGIEDARAGRKLEFYMIVPLVMGLLGSTVGLILRCQTLEARLHALENKNPD